MLKYERLERIEEYVNRNKYATIHQLAEEFAISGATIRRDLEDLGDSGRVMLTRGGVVSNKSNLIGEAPYNEKINANRDEKNRIAAAAAKYVHPGATVIIDSGTTTREITKFVAEVPGLNLVTNDVMIAAELTNAKAVHATVLGGSLRHGYFTLSGHHTDSLLAQLRADIAFLGMDAIGLAAGCMIANMDEVGLKRGAIRAAKRTIILVDHTKFTTESFISVCKLSAVSLIITGKELDPQVYNAFVEAGISLELV